LYIYVVHRIVSQIESFWFVGIIKSDLTDFEHMIQTIHAE